MTRLCEQMRIHAQPAVAFSDRILTPVVVGIFKPMILLPAAVVTQLTPSQLETILAHELAHIRRFDHLLLLVQRLIEAVLFFHPAVWWLSGKIESTRERCCDDVVLNSGAEAADYAESLVIFSELKQAGMTNTGTMRLAAAGRRSSDLRRRILRILGQPQPSWFRLSRGGLVAAVLLMAAALYLPTTTVMGDAQERNPDDENSPVEAQSLPPDDEEKKKKPTHRLQFVPREGTAGRTSWSSFGLRLAGIEGLSLSANVALGGVFPLTAPDGQQEWARGEMLKGDDGMLTLRFFNYVGEEVTLDLKRDEPQTVRIGKRDFRVVYPTAVVAIDSPNRTDLAHLFISHQPEESSDDRFISEEGTYQIANGTREVSLSIDGATLQAKVKFVRESGFTATAFEWPLSPKRTQWFAYVEGDRVWFHDGSDRFVLVSATPAGIGTFAVDKDLAREVPAVVRMRIKDSGR